MKTLIYAALVVSALAAPALSFAQSTTAPITRAEVKADLAQVEQAGYRPISNDAYYPADIQAAEARVASQHTTTQADTSYGGVSAGSSQAGAPMPAAGTHLLYFGH